MKKVISVIGVLLVLAVVAVGALQYFKPDTLKMLSRLVGAASAPEIKVEDFYLLDHQGRAHALYRQSDNKALVLISTANGCQAMKEAAPKIKALRDKFGSQGIAFWLIDSNPQDDRASIAKEEGQLGLDLPVLEDRAQLVATALGFAQTCDVICVGTTNWMTFYRGAIDRQSADPKTKARGAKNYLENALAKFVAGKSISPNRTLAKGTAIHLAIANDSPAKSISYAGQ